MLSSHSLDSDCFKRRIEHVISKLIGIARTAVELTENKVARFRPIRLSLMILQSLDKPATTHIQLCMTRSRRRRSTTSASAPAGRPTRTTGKLPNVLPVLREQVKLSAISLSKPRQHRA